MHPLVFDAFMRFYVSLFAMFLIILHCVRNVSKSYIWLIPFMFILIYAFDDILFKYDYYSRQVHYSKNTNGYPHVLHQLHEIYPDRINIENL
jgi:hypothetical protein